jgi:cullin 3
MESAIVKIMKTTKQLSHKVLDQEVIQQIDIKSETFGNDIKIRINDLIERQFLKRDDNSEFQFIVRIIFDSIQVFDS